MNNPFRLTFMVAVLGSMCTTASAQIQTFTDLGSFTAATTTTLQATFESLAEGCQPSPLVQGSVIFNAAPGSAGCLYVASPSLYQMNPPPVSRVLTQNGNEDFDITFSGSAPVAVGFDVYTNMFGPPSVTLTVFDVNGAQLGAFPLAQALNTLGFFGIKSNTPIGRIHWLGNGGDIQDTAIDNVRVGAGAMISISPTKLDFGPVGLNDTETKTLTITNIGPAGSVLAGSIQAPLMPFSISSGGGTFSLASGQTQNVIVAFQSFSTGSFDGNILVISNDTTTPSVSVPLHGAIAETVDLWINAFIPNAIPGLTLTAPAPFSIYSAIRGPEPLYQAYGSLFFTDQRSFSSDSAASARMHSEINLNIAFGPVFIAEIERPGPTIEIGQRGARNPYRIVCNKTANNSRMHFTNLRGSPDLIQVDVVAAANNPCVPFSPDIDYTGTVTIDVRGRTISFSGLIEPFPAFEMWAIVNNYPAQLIFKAPPTPGADPWNLIGFANVPASGSAPFSN